MIGGYRQNIGVVRVSWLEAEQAHMGLFVRACVSFNHKIYTTHLNLLQIKKKNKFKKFA